MEKLGDGREMYGLVLQPEVTFRPRRSGAAGSAAAPLFEPYPENLPLQSGYYSFVIDERGRLRVKAGNTRSHAAMAEGRAAAAGRFRMSRDGKLAEVHCQSVDYQFGFTGPEDRAVRYVIAYFRQHRAFQLSDHLFFGFHRAIAESFLIDPVGQPITPEQAAERRRRIDLEGVAAHGVGGFRSEQVAAWESYEPEAPSALYSPHRDQLIASLQEDADYEVSEARPPYSPQDERCAGGKYNFVFDPEGWLILGSSGHHLLSGCGLVGAAGQIVFDADGLATEVNLNFSGHYRPPLTAEYARYAYRVLSGHPLIELAPGCSINGRVFDEEAVFTTVLRFDPADLVGDGDELMLAIEAASF